jgi:UDP-N-acetylglucosamine:LPS N-acetylglucosamine transferase
MKKVIFISSTGGHLSELLQLKPLFEKYDSTLITEKNETTTSLNLDIPVKFLKFGTRKHLFSYLFIFTWNIVKSFYFYYKIKPDVIITTGAHTAVPLVYIAHFHKKKVVFIESCARVHSKSYAGILMEKKVDKLFVQWPEME